MYIKFAKTTNTATIPCKRDDDAGFDIYADKKQSIIIMPHTTQLIPTGLRSIIEKGFYVQIQERGSTGSKGIKYGAGVIDSNYRGEWFLATTNINDYPIVITNENMPDYDDIIDEVKLNTNLSEDYIIYNIDKALFQGIVHRTYPIEFMEITEDEINNDVTDRGEGKLGSSGK